MSDKAEKMRRRLANAEIALASCKQTLQIERRLRQRTEWHAAQYAESLDQERDTIHEALDECRIPRAYDDGDKAVTRTRIFWLNQRAERAEALAALVTPGLAELLEKIANATRGWTSIGFFTTQDGEATRAIAVEIREALDDNQA